MRRAPSIAHAASLTFLVALVATDYRLHLGVVVLLVTLVVNALAKHVRRAFTVGALALAIVWFFVRGDGLDDRRWWAVAVVAMSFFAVLPSHLADAWDRAKDEDARIRASGSFFVWFAVALIGAVRLAFGDRAFGAWGDALPLAVLVLLCAVLLRDGRIRRVEERRTEAEGYRGVREVAAQREIARDWFAIGRDLVAIATVAALWHF